MFALSKNPLLFLGLTLSVISSAFAINIENLEMAKKKEEAHPHCSPNVIPPNTPVNYFDLILTIGQDDALNSPGVTLFTLSGFKDILGWNNAKIVAYREKAYAWFNERYGIDFSGGTVDPVTGAVTTDFGIMIPYRYQGYFRVLSSTDNKIPPFTPNTPSSVGLAQYTAFFFFPQVYHGTYGGVDGILGEATDSLSYGTYRIFTNCKGTKHFTIFGRSYYPNTSVPNTFPARNADRFQLFSPVYGSGFSMTNSVILIEPNDEGKFPANAVSTMMFPGTFQPEFSDWNGFTEAPVNP